MGARRGLGIVCLTAALLGFCRFLAACSGDEEPSAPPYDGQGPGLPPLPPSWTERKQQADLVSFAPAYLGNATLIADVGEPTEGPAWRDRDGALYFTVPRSANPLRRVVPGAPVEIVGYDAGVTDAGASDGEVRLSGLASGGGDRLYATEPEALVAFDFDDAGAIAAVTRTLGPGGTSFGDITFVRSKLGDAVFFVDFSSTRTFRRKADGGVEHVLTSQSDSGRVSAIAYHDQGIPSGLPLIYVATTRTSLGDALVTFGQRQEDDGFVGADTGIPQVLGLPANGIAIDTEKRMFIAYAEGIVIRHFPSGKLEHNHVSLVSLRIAAIPTCLTFGGADRKTLFVTTLAGKIYSVPTTVAGILR